MTDDRRIHHLHAEGGYVIVGVELAGEYISLSPPPFVEDSVEVEIRPVGWGKDLIRYECWLGDAVCAVSQAVPK